MLFPIQLASIVVAVGRSTGVMSAALIVLLLAGTFLSYKGYSRERRCSTPEYCWERRRAPCQSTE